MVGRQATGKLRGTELPRSRKQQRPLGALGKSQKLPFTIVDFPAEGARTPSRCWSACRDQAERPPGAAVSDTRVDTLYG